MKDEGERERGYRPKQSRRIAAAPRAAYAGRGGTAFTAQSTADGIRRARLLLCAASAATRGEGKRRQLDKGDSGSVLHVASGRQRSFPLRVEQLLWPAYVPRSQEWSRGRRYRDAHASTRSLRGPSTADGPGWAHRRWCRVVQRRATTRSFPAPGRAAPPARVRPAIPRMVSRPAVPRCACVDAKPPRPVHGRWSRLSPRPMVPRCTAPCSSGVARARPTVPVGPAADGAPRSMRLGAGHAESPMVQ